MQTSKLDAKVLVPFCRWDGKGSPIVHSIEGAYIGSDAVEALARDLAAGEFHTFHVFKVLAVNEAEGTIRDVTRDVARETMWRVSESWEDLSDHVDAPERPDLTDLLSVIGAEHEIYERNARATNRADGGFGALADYQYEMTRADA